MIRYLKHKDIDKQRWDNCIANSDNRLIYALSWYLDIVSPGWDALINGDYEAVMPLTWKKKIVLKYLVQPMFCQQLGVFGNRYSIEQVEPFIKKLPLKYLHIRIHLNSENSVGIKELKTFWKNNYELNLNVPYNDIFNSFSTIHKKNIKTGRNRNISVKHSFDIPMFWDFFMKNHQAKFKLNTASYKVLQLLLNEIAIKTEYTIYFAESDGGELIASIFLMKAFNRWILLLSPSTMSGSRNRAVYLLIDHFLKERAEKNEILDFEGSNIKGIADFYSGFGAREKTYALITYSRLPIIR